MRRLKIHKSYIWFTSFEVFLTETEIKKIVICWMVFEEVLKFRRYSAVVSASGMYIVYQHLLAIHKRH